jgi:hypothetical protein
MEHDMDDAPAWALLLAGAAALPVAMVLSGWDALAGLWTCGAATALRAWAERRGGR